MAAAFFAAILVATFGMQATPSGGQRTTKPPSTRGEEWRWVVEKVKVGMEISGDISVIHPTLVRAKNGDLLLYGNAYPGNRFKAKTYDVLMARSRSKGETWSAPGRVFAEPLLNGQKTVCVQFGITLKSGRIALIAQFGSTEVPSYNTTNHPT